MVLPILQLTTKRLCRSIILAQIIGQKWIAGWTITIDRIEQTTHSGSKGKKAREVLFHDLESLEQHLESMGLGG